MKLARRAVALVASLVFLAALAASAAAQTDPQIGVWRINLAKSRYNTPPPKGATTKIEAAGAGTKVTVDQVASDGTKRHYEFTSNYDGKEVKVTGNNPDADTVARSRVDAHTIKTINKKDGKVTTTQTSTVSNDGKTRTVTTTGVNGAGAKVNNIAVYDKQ